MKLIKLAFIASSILLASAIQAKELHNNGHPVNSGIGLNNSYQTVLDDVYVSGAGWFVEEVETQGIFYYSNQNVSQVNINIWFATDESYEPDGNIEQHTFVDVPFTASSTGEYWGGYEKIEVLADIPRTFLKGQNYYWVEFEISDQSGNMMKLLETSNIDNLPAFLRSGGQPFEGDNDLSYKLYGDEVSTLMPKGSSEFKIGGLDKKQDTLTFQLADGGKAFEPGMYQLQMLRNTPVVYRLDKNGKKRIEFKVPRQSPVGFHTPIGNEMCELAPREIQSYCQTFVACAAYDLYCN